MIDAVAADKKPHHCPVRLARIGLIQDGIARFCDRMLRVATVTMGEASLLVMDQVAPVLVSQHHRCNLPLSGGLPHGLPIHSRHAVLLALTRQDHS